MNSFVYYRNKKVTFEIPSGWNVLFGGAQAPIPAARNPMEKIRKALDNPIGSPRIEELTHHGMKAVILFDDLTRPTPAYLVFPELLNRLNERGIEDRDISAVCALGTHSPLSSEDLKTKIGAEAFERLQPRVLNHDPLSKDNVTIGRTTRGSVVEINPHVHESDLIIGIGSCVPHVWAGFAGGSKIIMPGVCSARSVAEHHMKWIENHSSRIGKVEGNFFYEEQNEVARIAGLDFKIDFIWNEGNEVVDVFCGDVVKEHQKASQEVMKGYMAKIPRLVDVSIVSSFPMEPGLQSLKGLDAGALVTKRGGKVIWISPQDGWEKLDPFIEEVASGLSANDYLNQLMAGNYPERCAPMGISALLCIWDMKKIPEKLSQVVHVCEGLARDQVEAMGMTYASSIDEAVDMVHKELPKADVAIFASGGTTLPVLRG